MKKTAEHGHIPTNYGYNIRPITEHSHEYKSEEWKLWLLRYFPIYGKRRLPADIYEEIMSLVRAICICDLYEITPDQLEEVRGRLIRFIDFYERTFYQFREDRLPACKPTFHTIAHVHEFIAKIGPAFVSACWCMERV
ncbi:hypothetical protein BJ508DRAFT_211713, partial [Ascobolus immersus RN42]